MWWNNGWKKRRKPSLTLPRAKFDTAFVPDTEPRLEALGRNWKAQSQCLSKAHFSTRGTWYVVKRCAELKCWVKLFKCETPCLASRSKRNTKPSLLQHLTLEDYDDRLRRVCSISIRYNAIGIRLRNNISRSLVMMSIMLYPSKNGMTDILCSTAVKSWHDVVQSRLGISSCEPRLPTWVSAL